MKKGKMIVTAALWLAVFAVLSLFMKPTKNTSCVAQDGQLEITGRSGYALTIVYDTLTAAEYRTEMDFGTLLNGVDDSKEKSGQWENDELGQYRLCVNAKVASCIVLQTQTQTMVINYESEASTQALYEALLEQMPKTPAAEGKMTAVTTVGFVDVDGVKLSQIQIQYDYLVTLEPFQLYDSDGGEIDAHIVNAYVNSAPQRIAGAAKGEGSGCYVILEMETDFTGGAFSVKQVAMLRTECVIASPTVRRYDAE